MAQKGAQPGNKNAHKGRMWHDALRKAIAQDDGLRLRKAAETLLDKAADGEGWAIREIADRLDGKPFQSVELVGDPNNPLQVENSTRPQLTKEEWLKLHGVGTASRPAK